MSVFRTWENDENGGGVTKDGGYLRVSVWFGTSLLSLDFIMENSAKAMATMVWKLFKF